ncbi:MAG: class I SAM-dependent methyltransferase [Lentisphaerae bacterium]|nr:class I SAM-dependent methyltransferase [Lentisphaerota bacterium]
MAVCANWREARCFQRFEFKEVLLTGMLEEEEVRSNIERLSPHFSYQRHNCENTGVASNSFDLVFCKEGLHHLARPVLGLYEMLRIARQAVIIIEPYETLLGRVFECLHLSTVYETPPPSRRNERRNFVYRWNRRRLESILNSYYLDSGYVLDITLGWMSSRYNARQSKLVVKLAAIAGWTLGFTPLSRGNYMTAIITPGSDIPPEPGQRAGE